MDQANSVRLLPWFLSTVANPEAGPVHSLREALTTVVHLRMDAPAGNTAPQFKSSQAPPSTSSPVHLVSTLPPLALPVLDIPAAGTLVGHPFFVLTIDPRHKKQDHSPDGTPNDWCGKRAHAETTGANASSKCIFSSTQPKTNNGAQAGTSSSSDHLGPEINDPLSSPAKGTANPDDGVAVEVSGRTGDHDRDSMGDASVGKVDKCIEESDSDSESQTSTTNSDQESVTGDCLTCSDTEEAVVKIAHKKFHKKVQASCRPSRKGLWKVPQMAWIDKYHQAVWASNFGIVWTEWELALDEAYGSFEVNRMTMWTDQLHLIKEATRVKNIYPWEPEAKAQGRKKILVQSVKQFHVWFYWLYKKGTTYAIVSLQEIYLGDALQHPNGSTGVGVKSFCPWYLNKAEIPKQLPFTSGRYTIGWQSYVIYAGHVLAGLPRTSSTITQDEKWSMTMSTQSMKDKRRLTSPTRKRSLSHKDRREHPSSSVQILPRSHMEWNFALCPLYSHLVNPANKYSFCLGITLNFF